MWIPAILLVLIFAPQGWSEFDDASGWATAFRHWGFPDWFRVAIGVMEVGAVVLLLLGRTAAFGAVLIIVVMLGGMATHIIFDGGRHLASQGGERRVRPHRDWPAGPQRRSVPPV